MADDKKKIDEVTGVETTGHEWDGIEELNMPLPKWWLNIFYATIVFSIIYMVLYPAWPLLTSNTQGVLGYSSRADVYQAVEEHAAGQTEWRARLAETPVEEILEDPELLRFAMAGGASAFAVNCSQCHGSGAAGSLGYPNLNDDDWIWGGTIADIYQTIAHGIRNESFDSRFSEMPAFEGMLSDEEIDALTHRVMALGGLEHDPALSEQGDGLYLDNCASCHGDAGQGDVFTGAPALSDEIWLRVDDEESIRAQILQPEHGVMPGWIDRLDPVTIVELSVYVHSLGGGE